MDATQILATTAFILFVVAVILALYVAELIQQNRRLRAREERMHQQETKRAEGVIALMTRVSLHLEQVQSGIPDDAEFRRESITILRKLKDLQHEMAQDIGSLLRRS